MNKTFKIEVDCANCANKVENAIKKVDGVKDATINFMMQKLIIDFEEGIDIEEVMKEINKKSKKAASDFKILM